MGRRVMRKVHVRVPGSSAKFTYQAGDEVPDEHAEYITNPGAWLGENDHSPEPNPDNTVEITDELSELSVRQLTKLANDKNVEMPANAKKQDLLTALRNAGVISIG